MKNFIKQKVSEYLNDNEMFSVVLTKCKKTYQLDFETREDAMNCFIKFITEECHFCQLIGKKSTIGLYRKDNVGKLICIRQLTMNGFSA